MQHAGSEIRESDENPQNAPNSGLLRVAWFLRFPVPVALLFVVCFPHIRSSPGKEWNERSLRPPQEKVEPS